MPRRWRSPRLAGYGAPYGHHPEANAPIRVDGMETIVREVVSSRTKPMDPRVIRAESLAVFDRWNAEPPSFGASVSLLSVYAVSVLAAISVLYLAMFLRPPGAPPLFERPPANSVEKQK